MNYGPHSQLVEEVIDFASGGGVLSAIGPAEETAFVRITNDLRLALETSVGEGEIGSFQIAAQVDVSDWGNIDLLGKNLVRGENRTIDEAGEDLLWTWQDLTENLVAELIWTTDYWQRPDRKALHDPLFKRFHGSSLERELRDLFKAVLPPTEPLEGWQHCAEHLANDVSTELWYCAENRAFNGLTDNFWERVFQLYKEGLWPCGWIGTFPAPGKFMAYRRA